MPHWSRSPAAQAVFRAGGQPRQRAARQSHRGRRKTERRTSVKPGMRVPGYGATGPARAEHRMASRCGRDAGPARICRCVLRLRPRDHAADTGADRDSAGRTVRILRGSCLIRPGKGRHARPTGPCRARLTSPCRARQGASKVIVLLIALTGLSGRRRTAAGQPAPPAGGLPRPTPVSPRRRPLPCGTGSAAHLASGSS